MARYIKWMVLQEYMSQSQLEEFQSIDFGDVELSNIYLRSYFSSLDDLMDSLDRFFECHLESEKYDTSEFDTLKSVLFLAWFGFTCKEMIEIKKNELIEEKIIEGNPPEKKKIIIIASQGKAIMIKDEFCVHLLWNYRNRDVYYSRKFGHEKRSEVKYKESEYFLRSCRSSKLSERAVNAMVDKMNIYEEEIGRHFNINSIYLSGIYFRIIEEEEATKKVLGDTEYTRMANLFKYPLRDIDNISYDEKRILRAKYEEFQKYKKVFYEKL